MALTGARCLTSQLTRFEAQPGKKLDLSLTIIAPGSNTLTGSNGQVLSIVTLVFVQLPIGEHVLVKYRHDLFASYSVFHVAQFVMNPLWKWGEANIFKLKQQYLREDLIDCDQVRVIRREKNDHFFSAVEKFS